jgi:hypothetical protein
MLFPDEHKAPSAMPNYSLVRDLRFVADTKKQVIVKGSRKIFSLGKHYATSAFD